MSQPNPKYNEFDYNHSSRERRGPAPITNLPVNALSGDIDPTRELRALIEQLQQAARDSKAQVHVLDNERNELATQLDHFRRQNEELRAHFVEITSIIRERDSALQDAERLGRQMNEAHGRVASLQRELSDAQRQRDELVRTREELARQRDEIQRQLESLTQQSQDTNRRFNDVQRQLFTIRQARDTAQAQNTELATKLATAQDQLLDLRDQLDAAETAAEEAKAKATDPAELAALRTARDQAQARIGELS
jgi:chromosome segregation protein